jgi:hypothetical protein
MNLNSYSYHKAERQARISDGAISIPRLRLTAYGLLVSPRRRLLNSIRDPNRP